MAPGESIGNKKHTEEEVDFEGLQPLLRRGLNCNELEVLDYTAKKLLPLGENYCSDLVKVEATVRKAKDDSEEKLSVVAKTSVAAENPIVRWIELLPKEVFVYTDLLPAYRSIEREVGIEEGELCNVLPKYMGHRYSIKGDDKVDDTGLLLMENLIARGFYLCDRFKGVDFEHARKALTALARYHALGIALKRKRPEFFEKVVAQARVVGIDLDQMKSGYEQLKENLREDRCFARHMPTIELGFDKFINWNGELIADEPWASVTHGDFWSNNMLFHKDAEGNVDDVKFVDFQMYYYTSPLRDLPYFLCGSLDEAARRDHFDELLNLYYGAFVDTLERVGCDASQFSRESFDEELKVRAVETFPLIAMVQKFTKYEVASDDEDRNQLIQTLMNKTSMSDKFRNNLLKVVQLYEDKKWF